jgi:hypothetical protein
MNINLSSLSAKLQADVKKEITLMARAKEEITLDQLVQDLIPGGTNVRADFTMMMKTLMKRLTQYGLFIHDYEVLNKNTVALHIGSSTSDSKAPAKDLLKIENDLSSYLNLHSPKGIYGFEADADNSQILIEMNSKYLEHLL